MFVSKVNILDLEDVNELWALSHELHVKEVPNKFNLTGKSKYNKETLLLELFSGTTIFGCFDIETKTMVGMVQIESSLEDISIIKIKNMFVREQYRNEGIGDMLFQYLIDYIDRYDYIKTIESKSYIVKGRSFWINRGFKDCGNANEYSRLLRYTKEV